MSIPIVSIIVPCYNQAQYLDECLHSILDQTYTNWECIIVNDGSSDDTETKAQAWCKKDERFTYFIKENGGLSSARNFGIANSNGEFILPLDADDKISPEYVSLAVKSFQEDISLKVVYCKAEKFGSENGLWNLPSFSLHGLAKQNMIFCSALFKKLHWELVGGYDEKMKYGWEDWEFWIAMLKDGGNVKCIDKVGFYYRMKPNSMIQSLDKVIKDMLLNYMSIKHASFFVEQLGSFTQLSATAHGERTYWKNKLKNKKFVFDVFCATFFGFIVFGLYKTKK